MAGAPSADIAVSREAAAAHALRIENRPDSLAGLTEGSRSLLTGMREIEAAKGTRASMEMVRSLPVAKIDEAIDQNTSFIRSEETGKKQYTREQQEKQNKAREDATRINKYLKDGLKGLSESEVNQTLTSIESRLTHEFPQIKELLDKLAPGSVGTEGVLMSPARAEIIKQLLGDTKFSQELRSLLEGTRDKRLDFTVPPELQEEVRRAEAEFKEKEKAWKAKDHEVNLLSKQMSSEFKAPDDPTQKNKYTELQGLNTDYDKLQSEKKKEEAELEKQNAVIRRLTILAANARKHNGGSIDEGGIADLSDAQTLAEEAQRKLSGIESKLARKKQLEDERVNLQNRINEGNYQVNELQIERDIAARSLSLAKVPIDEAREAFRNQEKEYFDQYERLWGEAASRVMESRFAEAEQLRQTHLDQKAQEAKTEEEKKFARIMATRWANKKYKNDKDQINADFNVLLAKGEEALMRNILFSAGISNPVQQEAYLKNEEFMSKYRDDLIETVVSKKLQVGKISNGEAQRIADMWGQDRIKNALNKKKEWQNNLADLYASGAIRTKGDLIKFLALLLGGGAILATGGALAAPMLGGAAAVGGLAGGAAGAGLGFGKSEMGQDFVSNLYHG